MSVKTIIITVPRRGLARSQQSITIEAEGYTGTSCKDATKAFETALGTVAATQEKPAMYETENAEEHLTNG